MIPTAPQRFDLADNATRGRLLPLCRLKPGDVWRDPLRGHVVACGDATDRDAVARLCDGQPGATLAIQDPPYNMVAFQRQPVSEFVAFCRQWLKTTADSLAADSSLYVWLGADQKNHFQPLPQFMLLMTETDFDARSFITLRNQRGYGTQKNWMCVRQELLYYARGAVPFDVQYTDIPRILRGYYKLVGERLTENGERSRSPFIRAGNVWVDIQQVFYRMEENVAGCYAQKPLKAIERILLASSRPGDTVLDFFAHAGTTLLACERTGRTCLTMDVDPIFAEVTIRRLEHFRRTGKTGWQRSGPFDSDLLPDATWEENARLSATS
jgi:site-specific DNA-methyltransferase (adenine-specific)